MRPIRDLRRACLPARRAAPGPRPRPPAAAALALALGTSVLLSACAGDAPSVLQPRSPAAERVEGLWWLTFAIATAVVIVVVAFLVVAVRRGRGQALGEVDRRPVAWGDRFIVLAGLVASGAILAGTFVVSLRAMDALSSPPEDPSLTIEVIGHNWWWEARYPNGAVTANEIHIPVGEAVEVELSTADVIHSFWVPQLNVKIDNVPGMENRLWLLADRAGRYRGQCAEYCGLQHAHMAFFVVAQPRPEFEAWLDRQASPAPEPETHEARRGRDIFVTSSCAGCHTIRGTPADGDLGPDLTHLASRETIGAGLLPLTRQSLADFTRNPQDDKPGATMPPTAVTPEELDALVEYMSGLD